MMMKLSERLTPSLIQVGLDSEGREELFEEMVEIFVRNGSISNRDAALQAIFEREAMMSTAIARGLAIPHGKLEECRELLIALGISKTGIEYDSLDGEPVYIVVMVLAEVDNPGPHLEALAEVSRLFSIPGFTQKLRSATTPQEVLRLIQHEE